jgi:hypothetical protein
VNEQTTSKTSTGRSGQIAGLWVSAVMLAFLVAVQATVSFGQPEAFAKGARASGMVSRTQTATIMTADGGAEDLILVLDSRTETISVYHLDIRSGLQPLQRLPLAQAFLDAKASMLGHP